ncbi:MAG: hypothetical protein AB7W16_06955 [Candidatus Obscuribacterales bacterium]
MIPSGPVFQNGLKAVQSLRAELASGKERVCVYGDGVEALALASLLRSSCIGVLGSVSNIPENVAEFEIRDRGASVCADRGAIPAGRAGDALGQAETISQADGIFICGDSTRYGEIAHSLSAYLRDGQTVCLVNAPLGAALQFRHELSAGDCDKQISVLELGRLYDYLAVESGVLLISGLRKRIAFASVERNEMRRGMSVARTLKRDIVPASNVIERGLSDVERLIRPVILLSALLGSHGDSLEIGFGSRALAGLLRSIEKEVQAIARSFGCTAPGFLEALCEIALRGDSFDEIAVLSVSGLLERFGVGIMNLDNLDQDASVEVLRGDVEEVFCILSDLGSRSRSPVGTINSVIDLASAVAGCDLRSQGRNLDSLGLVGFDIREIIDLVNC